MSTEEKKAEQTLVDWTAPHLAALGLKPLPVRDDWPEPPKRKHKPIKALTVKGAKVPAGPQPFKSRSRFMPTSLGDAVQAAAAKARKQD